jgi:release factor glutamine methyltransferase
MSNIYQPSDDSYLLQKTLKTFLKNKSKSINILDMGSGSGFLAQTAINLGFTNTLAADINPEAITHLKKQKIEATKSNLFSNIKTKFDLIVFNAPYLPEDKREPNDSKLATTAGKEGYELINKFLTQAKKQLNPGASILLLFSTLSKPNTILAHAKKLGYNFNLVNKQKIPFEELFVYEFKLTI